MSDFKPGDVVLCIFTGDVTGTRGDDPPLRKGSEYVINAINTCSKCDLVAFDVGIPDTNHMQICKCGLRTSPKGIWWCAAERFVKRQERAEAETITFTKKILEKPLHSMN